MLARPSKAARLSDVDLLLPSVAARLAWALSLVRGQGFSPLVFETIRSKARAAELAEKGTGTVDSIHCYGGAVDVICGFHQWNCARHHCGFYEVYGPAAEQCGFTWGGRWKRVDKPHIQAVPVRLQNAFRALSEADRDAFAAACLRGEQ